MNLPKLVFEDIPLFHGLIKDLFPDMQCPHFDHSDFSASVKAVLSEQGYVVLPAQVSFKVPYSNKVLGRTTLFQRLCSETRNTVS
jgi:hypothetical protein